MTVVITSQYFCPHKLNIPHLFSALMDVVLRGIIRPALSKLYNHMLFTGSAYELSALPWSSDFDIQVFLKMPPGPGKKNIVKRNTGLVEPCDRPGWRKIKGGPTDLLTTDGFLSAKKVCSISCSY